jgi:hypothetical protein
MSRDDERWTGAQADDAEDPEDDPGEELEAMIEQADRPFASESFGTTAQEQEEGESLDDLLAEERPSRPAEDEGLAIEDLAGPDDEEQLVGEGSVERDPFVAPEDAAMTTRSQAPGAVDHPGATVESPEDPFDEED